MEKTIKNVGRLTDKIIDEFQEYYFKAIRENCNGSNAIRRVVWATYFHRLSTDDKLSHSLSPPPPDTWCASRNAEAAGTFD